MRTHGERSRHRRSVQLEFLENRNLLTQVIASPPAEVRLDHDTVPIKLTFEGTADRTGLDGGPYQVTLIGSGYASQWGAYELGKTTHTLVIGPNGPTIENGNGTFVLANGDKVFVDYTGSGSIGSDGHSVTFNVNYMITGGTGRYDGVEGTIHAIVKADLSNTDVTATGEGEISSVGSLKRQQV